MSETVSLTLSYVTIKSVLPFFPGRALPPSRSITFLITVPDPDLETREEGRWQSSGPWDKGDPVSKMFFSALRALVWSKNNRDGPPPAPALDSPLNQCKKLCKEAKQWSGEDKTITRRLKFGSLSLPFRSLDCGPTACAWIPSWFFGIQYFTPWAKWGRGWKYDQWGRAAGCQKYTVGIFNTGQPRPLGGAFPCLWRWAFPPHSKAVEKRPRDKVEYGIDWAETRVGMTGLKNFFEEYFQNILRTQKYFFFPTSKVENLRKM